MPVLPNTALPSSTLQTYPAVDKISDLDMHHGTHTPLTPALGRQRQMDVYKFEESLYVVSSRPARVRQQNRALKQNNLKKLQICKMYEMDS